MTQLLENLVLNPVEFTPELPEIDLSAGGLFIAQAPDYGEAGQTVERVRQAIGEGVVSRHWPSVDCSIPLWVGADREVTKAQAYQPLEAFVGELQRGKTLWIRRDFADSNGFAGSVGCPVDAGSLTTPLGFQPNEVLLKLSRSPIWYATTEVLAGEASGTNVRDLQLELAELLGTAPGLIRFVVTNNGKEDWRGIFVSGESATFSSAETAEPSYEATELTLKGGAARAGEAPQIRAVGTVAAGTGPITPGLPAGTVAGDMLIMVAESGGTTAGGEATPELTVEGWGKLVSLQKGNTRLTVLRKIAVGGDTRTTNDTGDHQIARIIGIRVGTYDPNSNFNFINQGTQAPTKSVAIPGGGATRDNCLVIACASGNLPDSTTATEFGPATNSTLTGLTELIDNTTGEGDGGAIFAAAGVKATLGTCLQTTCTAVTEAERAATSLAINPYPEFVECPVRFSPGWSTVLSSEILGKGHWTHIGPRRMIFEVLDPTAETDASRLATWEALTESPGKGPKPDPRQARWKLEWRALGSANWIQTMEGSTPIVAVSPAVGGWQFLDMGECRPEPPMAGDARWEWRLQVSYPAAEYAPSIQPLIRVIRPMTMEQWLRASDTSENPIDGEVGSVGATVENATGVGSVAWKAHSGSGSMSFAKESEYPTVTFSGVGTSNYLKVTNLDFADLLPSAAAIRGVLVRAVPLVASGDIEEERARLIIEGVVKEAEDKAGVGGPLYWDTAEARSWGGPLDLWGLGAISRAQVVATNFGFALALSSPNTLPEVGETRTISFKRIEMIVAYSEGGDENRICFAGRAIEFSDNGVRRQHITDEVWGDLVPDGFLLTAPPGGQVAQPVRVQVVPSVGDLAERPNASPVNPGAKLFYRAGYLNSREAASG